MKRSWQARQAEAALLRARQAAPAMRSVAGLTLGKAAAELNARKVPSPTGSPWSAELVKRTRERIEQSE
jgi:hypothetical protein